VLYGDLNTANMNMLGNFICEFVLSAGMLDVYVYYDFIWIYA